MSIQYLRNILQSKEYIVQNTFSLNGIDKFIYIKHKNYPLLIDISKYSISSDDLSIKINPFNDLCIPKKYENPFIDRSISENIDFDSVLEMYQSIEIDSNEIENLKNNISILHIQLERIKYLTEKYKYKCCILCDSYIIHENIDGSIVQYISSSIMKYSICMYIDIDTFYADFEKNDTSFMDIYNDICKKIYTISSKAFNKCIDYTFIENLLKSFKRSISYHKKIKKYYTLIKKINSILLDISNKIKSINSEYSTLTDTSDESVYRRIQIDKDRNKLGEIHDLLNKKYNDIYTEYISLLLVFENDTVNKKILIDNYTFIDGIKIGNN